MANDDDYDDLLQVVTQDPWNYSFSVKLFTEMFLLRTEALYQRRAEAGQLKAYVAISPSAVVPGRHAVSVVIPLWEIASVDELMVAVKAYLADRVALAVATVELQDDQLRAVIEVQRMPRRAYVATTDIDPPRVVSWEPTYVGASIQLLPATWENVQ